MFIEIFVYLVIAFGTLILCVTMFEKDVCIDEKYIIIKKDNAKIIITVETQGIDDEEIKRLDWIIRKGKYDDIYDIVKEFKIIKK